MRSAPGEEERCGLGMNYTVEESGKSERHVNGSGPIKKGEDRTFVSTEMR